MRRFLRDSDHRITYIVVSLDSTTEINPKYSSIYSVNLPNWPKYLGNVGKKALPGVRSPSAGT